MSTARRDDTPRGPDLAIFRLPSGSGEIHVDPTAYADPRAWAIILAELPDHIARAYTTNPASAIRVREELRRIMLAEWENPTGAPQEVLPDNVVPLKRKS